MTGIEYRWLANLNLHHAYFTQGQNGVFQITPTQATQALFDQYQCRFRVTTSGGQLWYAWDGRDSVVKRISQNAVFSFWIVNRQPDLFPITQLPANGTAYFSTNAAGVQHAGDGQPPSLRFKDYTGPQLMILPPHFSQRLNPEIRADRITVTRMATGETVLDVAAPDGPISTLRLNLAALPEGAYQIRADRKLLLSGVLTKGPQPFALVEIAPAGTGVPASQRLVPNGTMVIPKTYEIAFKTRSSIWKYNIFGLDKQDPKIVGPKDASEYLGPKPISVNGRTGMQFTSIKPIVLRDDLLPALNFKLRYTTSAKGDGEIQLPLASPGVTQVMDHGTRLQLVSTMNVYL
ncbi:hypothetical protein [uncultured Ruegeria sp.]|uniref:hypothetical protein n=1 Tax=uncultured Ruegeria sp. TaxID=259304 RepID=UPI0026169352|nr:hypothetical protein [uncultured Ruegeria sp.]